MALGQGAKADRVGPRGRPERCLARFQAIPGNVLVDGEGGRAAAVEVHADRPRGGGRVRGDAVRAQTHLLEARQDFAAEGVVSDARDNHGLRAQGVGMIGEVRRSAAELLTRRQQVPEDLSQPDHERRRVVLRLHTNERPRLCPTQGVGCQPDQAAVPMALEASSRAAPGASRASPKSRGGNSTEGVETHAARTARVLARGRASDPPCWPSLAFERLDLLTTYFDIPEL